MSQVHDAIVLAAFSVQENKIKKVFNPYIEELKESSWYPDKAGDIRKNDPQNVRFLWPRPPKTSWQKKLARISLTSKFWTWCGEPPLNYAYLCRHYLENAVRSLKIGDIKSAVKFCGVYSHLIADVIEPGHAVFDWAIDIFAPFSCQNPSGEMFTNKECLRGPVSIKGYHPKLLGKNIKQAELGAIADLLEGSRFGAALAIPVENAIYSNKIKKATQFLCRAHNESAKKFADFLYTVFYLANQHKKDFDRCLDLCRHPFIFAEISCFCRFRPLVDIFLDPSCFRTEADFNSYSVGTFILKPQPLSLLSKDKKKAEKVHGLCVMPKDIRSEAIVEYLLAPGAYSKFSAKVGFNPTFKKSLSFISAVFTVLGDGKVLARSKAVRFGEAPVLLQAELGRTRFLTLSMRYSGNLSSKEQKMFRRYTSAVHGVWAEPVLCSEL
jgi:hypothetical protein